MEGQLLHKQADDPFYRQKNGECVSLRSVSIASKVLGLYGFTDVVELRPSDNETNSIQHPYYPGFWKPFPIEYKRGHSKPDERDEVQLAAQVICLEEMHNIKIDKGYLFYWESRRREEVVIDEVLRQMTQQYADEMHSVFKTGVVPKAEKSRKCYNCSLLDICLPDTKNKLLATNYLKKNLYEETP
jgi:CRISPR-associated exonuclease Cas4